MLEGIYSVRVYLQCQWVSTGLEGIYRVGGYLQC